VPKARHNLNRWVAAISMLGVDCCESQRPPIPRAAAGSTETLNDCLSIKQVALITGSGDDEPEEMWI
jgi:hypothetical protein